MGKVAFVRRIGIEQSLIAGRGVQLWFFYKLAQIKSGVSFISEIPHFPSDRDQFFTNKHSYTIIISGRVQKVAFRAAFTNIFNAIKSVGEMVEITNLPDGTVQVKLIANKREIERLFKYIKAEASFHVVFGTQRDFDKGKCVVVKGGGKVPTNAKYVYTPRVTGVEIIEDLPLEVEAPHLGPRGERIGRAP